MEENVTLYIMFGTWGHNILDFKMIINDKQQQ